MDFVETSEQRLLRDSVRRFAAEAYPFAGGRKPLSGRAGHWHDIAANGWTGVGLPEDVGGLGPAPVEMAIILEEFGRGRVTEPLPFAMAAAHALSLSGNAAQRGLLADVVAGDLRLAFAHEERATRGAIAEVATSARRVGDGWEISGAKSCVYWAGPAPMLLVSARTSGMRGDRDGLSVFLVPSKNADLHRTDYLTIDGFDATDLRFDRVVVGDDALVGEPGAAYAVLEGTIDLANVALGAEAIGLMDRALYLTRDYVSLRRQFGSPIGSFQAIRHRLADMVGELEMARSLLHAALASRFGADRVVQARAASACKARIGTAGRFICENAIQLHGGIGMADETEVGHHYRRLLAIDATFGNTDFHLQRFADLT